MSKLLLTNNIISRNMKIKWTEYKKIIYQNRKCHINFLQYVSEDVGQPQELTLLHTPPSGVRPPSLAFWCAFSSVFLLQLWRLQISSWLEFLRFCVSLSEKRRLTKI